MKYTKKQILQLLRDIYNGVITTDSLPPDLYEAIADYLLKGLYEGYGGKLADFGGVDAQLLNELRENTYMFSAAKTYQQINDISLIKGDDTIKSFKEFKDEALNIYDQYNVNWLQTEYGTAIGQGQNALRWSQIEQQKHLLPILRYSAVLDANTSEICAPLDGTTLPADDPFWDIYMPLNHFNCRCTVEQLEEGDAPLTDKADVEEATRVADEKMQDGFKMNPGKDGYVFSPDHPYFDVAPKDKDLAADNFGLPIPEAD